MEIKGTAVKTTEQFMRDRYAEKYLEWKRGLPDESKPFFKDLISVSKWYPLMESVIFPTETVAKVLGKTTEEAALELGQYSAEVALSGIYKIFVRISSPDFVISRATQVFSTYYNPGSIEIIEKNKNSLKARIKNFSKQDSLVMYRIAGWIQGTLQVTRRKTINVELDIKELEDDKLFCEILASWST
ncbi:MAG: hypothetical protein KAI79_07985 [Bacteroidales bacterium]|nr:hypothetical protein [Bacteroidales bacterium]